jgi:hypothetical protein
LEYSAANSVITHQPSGRAVSFGQVAEATAKLQPSKDVPLKFARDLSAETRAYVLAITGRPVAEWAKLGKANSSDQNDPVQQAQR